jgi:hypothetical protein
MKRKPTRLLIISCALAMLAGSLNSGAQEKKEVVIVKEDHAIGFRLVGGKFDFGKVVTGAPYSATAITEHIQTLHDGNQIIRKNESKLYRDSEGRTRNEQSLETIGKWNSGDEAKQLISIADPVANTRYSLDPSARMAYRDDAVRISFTKGRLQGSATRITKINRAQPHDVEIVVEKDDQTGKFRLKGKPIVRKEILQRPKKIYGVITKDGVSPQGKERWKTETLGKETIEGVEVEHTRSTFTIPAGEIGNVQPIEIVDESWYSPELQIMIMTRYRDPREGETTYRLTNISRSEPDRSLFEVPAEYTIQNKKFPPAKKKRLPRPGE